MKNRECPHLSECKQFVLERDFEWKCLGEISWNQENCFKSNVIGTKELRELPMMWWATKLIDRYREMKSEKKDLQRNAHVQPKVTKEEKQNEDP